MDPRSLNQNTNQAPVSPVSPVSSVNPVNLANPVSPTDQTVSVGASGQAMPVNPAVAASPAVPTSLGTPQMQTPVSQVTLQNPASFGIPQVPTPVNPVVNPGIGMNPNVAMPAIDPSLVVMETPGNATGANVADVMVGATDPITMPNLPKAPDPVEEELKAPMTAAAPVPGSIGSAISVPIDQPQTPNVAFNDPAMQQNQSMSQKSTMPSTKKSKKTLILLCAIAGIAVVALAIVLIMTMNGQLI